MCRNLTSHRYVYLILIGFPCILCWSIVNYIHVFCIHSPCTGVFSTLTVSEIKIVYQLNLERCFTLFWNTFPLVVKKWLIKWNWQEHFWKAWNKQHKICCMYAFTTITIINDLIHYAYIIHNLRRIIGNPPGSTVWANFPIFILSNIRASHRCNKSWKMIRINRSIFPIFATSMTNTSVRQDESGKRNHKRWIKWCFILWQQVIYKKIQPAFLRGGL